MLKTEWEFYQQGRYTEAGDNEHGYALRFAAIILHVLQNITNFESRAQGELPADSESMFESRDFGHFQRKWAYPIESYHRLGRKCLLYGAISLDSLRVANAGKFFGTTPLDFYLTRNFVYYVENNLMEERRAYQCHQIVELRTCICHQLHVYLTLEKIAAILELAPVSVLGLHSFF